MRPLLLLHSRYPQTVAADVAARETRGLRESKRPIIVSWEWNAPEKKPENRNREREREREKRRKERTPSTSVHNPLAFLFDSKKQFFFPPTFLSHSLFFHAFLPSLLDLSKSSQGERPNSLVPMHVSSQCQVVFSPFSFFVSCLDYMEAWRMEEGTETEEEQPRRRDSLERCYLIPGDERHRSGRKSNCPPSTVSRAGTGEARRLRQLRLMTYVFSSLTKTMYGEKQENPHAVLEKEGYVCVCVTKVG